MVLAVSYDTYMKGNYPKMVERHGEVLGCAPYLPGGSKYWGPPAPGPTNTQQ